MMVLMMHAPPSVRTRARRVADGIGAGGESPPLHSPFPRDAALSLSLSLTWLTSSYKFTRWHPCAPPSVCMHPGWWAGPCQTHAG